LLPKINQFESSHDVNSKESQYNLGDKDKADKHSDESENGDDDINIGEANITNEEKGKVRNDHSSLKRKLADTIEKSPSKRRFSLNESLCIKTVLSNYASANSFTHENDEKDDDFKQTMISTFENNSYNKLRVFVPLFGRDAVRRTHGLRVAHGRNNSKLFVALSKPWLNQAMRLKLKREDCQL
jgi:hypothetical protein